MKCVTCKKDKPYDADNFKLKNEKLGVTCLTCLEKKKKWADDNREARLETSHKWVNTHKEQIKKYQKSYREGKMREHRLSLKKDWASKNKDRIKAAIRKYHVERMKNDPNYRLARNIRKRFAMAIKKGSKGGSAIKCLGCSIEELKKHLELQFKEGMNWDNYGKSGWHIDHIIPLVKFDLTNLEDVRKVCHYTNLQPLWAEENLSKGDNVQ